MNQAVNPYQQTQVITASPENILIMLYDGAIRFVSQARVAIEDGKRLNKLEAIRRALAIITCLADTLDHNAGWDGSEDLDALYGYMVRELTRANLSEQIEPLSVVLSLLSGLRETWNEAIEVVWREGNPVSTTGEAFVEQHSKSFSVES